MSRFRDIFWCFGGMAAFGPLGSAFEGHGSPPSVITCMRIHTEFKADIYTDYLQKVHANFPLHRQVISQIETKRSGVGVEAV